METLRDFWTWAFILGIGSFYVMVLIVIPLGFFDLLKLFRNLKEEEQGDD